jgi:hypothetical protein
MRSVNIVLGACREFERAALSFLDIS